MPLWTDYGNGWQQVKAARADNPHAAFLCCPGPSLARLERDLRGRGRTIYALNTAYPKVKPDVWIGLDRMACFDAGLWEESFAKVTRYFRDDTGRMRHRPNVFYADIAVGNVHEIFTRRDNESKFLWVRNSLMFALNFLVWSGHKRIYLVGCDLGGETDYYDARVLTAEQRANNRRLYDAQRENVRQLAPLAARNGIEFISCTEDSPLNHFLRYVPVDEAIAEVEPPREEKPPVHVFEADKKIDRNVVLVLRSGGDFRPEHVERLERQIKDCTITLLTDYPASMFPHIHVEPLRHNWPGWWAKMELHSPQLEYFRNKPFLFLDLDSTIYELPDAFFSQPRSVAMAPYNHDDNHAGGKLDTNIMLLHPRDRALIWERWREDPERWMKQYWIEQAFVDSVKEVDWLKWHDLFPDAMASYKQNIVPNRNFAGGPLDRSKIKVLSYHGKPRPWEVEG
jgi:hypothetical protein